MKSVLNTKNSTFKKEQTEQSPHDSILSRKDFRQLIRQKRNQLNTEQQHQAGLELAEQCLSLSEFQQAQHIALYISVDGEINTHPLIEQLWALEKQVYVPVLHPFSAGHLLFLRYSSNTPLTYNKYGIAEPILDQRQIGPVSQLNLIATPLVGFDNQGHRLGMGGGYYDRTLETWFKTGQGAIPIGLAHECQHVTTLPTEKWDVPLPAIITPHKTWRWS